MEPSPQMSCVSNNPDAMDTFQHIVEGCCCETNESAILTNGGEDVDGGLQP
jgi:hypothetical protein